MKQKWNKIKTNKNHWITKDPLRIKTLHLTTVIHFLNEPLHTDRWWGKCESYKKKETTNAEQEASQSLDAWKNNTLWPPHNTKLEKIFLRNVYNCRVKNLPLSSFIIVVWHVWDNQLTRSVELWFWCRLIEPRNSNIDIHFLLANRVWAHVYLKDGNFYENYISCIKIKDSHNNILSSIH